MSGYFEEIEKRGHEQVCCFYCPKTKLRYFVAIHSTILGPSLGGCRMREYPNEAAALEDVLRLSEGMTYKNALAGLALGGGKSCVWKNPDMPGDQQLVFEKIGKWVHGLSGRYIIAEDMGTSVENMRRVREFTDHVAGFPLEDGGSGDPSPWTALGVFHSIRAACELRFGSQDLQGKSVSIQGVGHVGHYLAEHLAQAGARLVISDTATKNLEAVVQKTGAKVLGVDAIYDAEVDIYSPCAVGQTVNDETLKRLKAKIVAGAANNQLAHPGLYSLLAQRDILYCPDFAINSGGVISCASEFIDQSERASWLRKKVDDIFLTCQKVLRISREEGKPSEEVAITLAQQRLQAGASSKAPHESAPSTFTNSSQTSREL